MNKKWQIYETNKEKVKELEEKYGINELLATILVNRNIVNEDEIRLFLQPTRNDFHDPLAAIGISKTIIVTIMATIASMNASNLSVEPSSWLWSLAKKSQNIDEIITAR